MSLVPTMGRWSGARQISGLLASQPIYLASFRPVGDPIQKIVDNACLTNNTPGCHLSLIHRCTRVHTHMNAWAHHPSHKSLPMLKWLGPLQPLNQQTAILLSFWLFDTGYNCSLGWTGAQPPPPPDTFPPQLPSLIISLFQGCWVWTSDMGSRHCQGILCTIITNNPTYFPSPPAPH